MTGVMSEVAVVLAIWLLSGLPGAQAQTTYQAVPLSGENHDRRDD
jgi:hypothetical protein